jgi:hypothetical protein
MASQLIFKETLIPPPQAKILFKAPKNIENLFGPSQQLTIDLKTPSNRKFKAVAQKIQSSPIKGLNDGNVVDKYIIVKGKRLKRAAKKGYVASLSKVKQTRLANTGRFGVLADQEIEYCRGANLSQEKRPYKNVSRILSK